MDDRAILHRKRAGQIVPLRHGAYALATAWQASDGRTRHLMLSEAVLELFRDDVALSHVSAAIAYGAPDWQVPLGEAHLTSLNRVGERNRARVRHHRGELGVLDVTRREGHWITTPTRTALDTASILTRDAAVCVLDWFIEQGGDQPARAPLDPRRARCVAGPPRPDLQAVSRCRGLAERGRDPQPAALRGPRVAHARPPAGDPPTRWSPGRHRRLRLARAPTDRRVRRPREVPPAPPPRGVHRGDGAPREDA
ncbi:hypothetical protein [uncultured Nocardioides sp.]|uniref:hypothetical protein n=1 Tax=uncultured Nocardioides sp. TaxID=198441 RepID=UPI0034310895